MGASDDSFIGPSVRLKGNMTSEDGLAIAGEFNGNIDIATRDVTVSVGAIVEADIRASRVIICGKVRGNVQGIDKVELARTADMIGRLETREIRVEEGAIYRGQVDIIVDDR